MLGAALALATASSISACVTILTGSQANNGAVLRALAAQQAGELAGVDVGNGHGVLAHQVLRQRFRLAEVAGQQWQILDDQACGMDLVSFDVLGVDAVIADVRVRQGDDLLAVAGVSEDFLVAGDGGVEHHFADGGAGGTDRIADKDRAVCERQDGGREGSLERQKHWVLRMVTVARRLLATRRASANGCSQMGYCFGCGRATLLREKPPIIPAHL
jgi:hypothetical protein